MVSTRNPAIDWMARCGARLVLLAGLTAIDLRSNAVAQGFGPDPYRPYNSRYDPFVYPVAPGDLDYGYNQGFAPVTRNGARNANQFQNYLDSVRGPGNARTGGGTGAGAGTPYFRSDRTMDRDYDRVYQYHPNRQADAKYDSNQEEVSKLYFQYLRQKDPKKRAELFREYSRARAQADRALSTAGGSRTRGTTKAARKDSAAPPADERGARLPRGADVPPPLDGAGARGGRGRAGTRTEPATGAAPSPLDDRDSAATPTAEGPAPSRVLDRALRTAPGGRGPTRRSTTPPPLGEAPPP